MPVLPKLADATLYSRSKRWSGGYIGRCDLRDWHRQAITNTLKAAIPFKRCMRKAVRRIMPYRTNPGNDGNLFSSAVCQIELLRAAGLDVRGRRVLEIGSGWHPILPITFIAAGAESVTLTDVEYLIDPGSFDRQLILF